LRRAQQSSGELTASELTQARLHWIKAVQTERFPADPDALQKNVDLPRGSKISRFNPFLEDGFIRLGEHNSPTFPKKLRHPLLLDGKHFVHLIWQTHNSLHHLGFRVILSQLRKEFWILRARQTIKNVLHKCLPCTIAKNHRGQHI
jgi:hypothetical protein